MVLVVLVGMEMLRRAVMSDLLVRDMQEILYDEMGSLGLRRDRGRNGSVSLVDTGCILYGGVFYMDEDVGLDPRLSRPMYPLIWRETKYYPLLLYPLDTRTVQHEASPSTAPEPVVDMPHARTKYRTCLQT